MLKFSFLLFILATTISLSNCLHYFSLLNNYVCCPSTRLNFKSINKECSEFGGKNFITDPKSRTIGYYRELCTIDVCDNGKSKRRTFCCLSSCDAFYGCNGCGQEKSPLQLFKDLNEGEIEYVF